LLEILPGRGFPIHKSRKHIHVSAGLDKKNFCFKISTKTIEKVE